MRLEYKFEISQVDVPRFAVEAVEGMGKLFTLTTLVLNVLESKPQVELVFHGLNPEDPNRKIAAFLQVLAGSGCGAQIELARGKGGPVPGSSSYFQWVTLTKKK
jgi:hypothetical protein